MPAKTINIAADPEKDDKPIGQPDGFGQLPVDVLENKDLSKYIL